VNNIAASSSNKFTNLSTINSGSAFFRVP